MQITNIKTKTKQIQNDNNNIDENDPLFERKYTKRWRWSTQ